MENKAVMTSILNATNDNSIAGTGNLNTSTYLEIDVTSKKELCFQLIGTWAGVVTIQKSLNTTFTASNFENKLDCTSVSSVSTNGMYKVLTGGLKSVRIVFTRTSGTININYKGL
jgi:hypothetical protein